MSLPLRVRAAHVADDAASGGFTVASVVASKVRYFLDSPLPITSDRVDSHLAGFAFTAEERALAAAAILAEVRR